MIDFGLKDINPNKSPIEVIKEGAFGGTYFRDIYEILLMLIVIVQK